MNPELTNDINLNRNCWFSKRIQRGFSTSRKWFIQNSLGFSMRADYKVVWDGG